MTTDTPEEVRALAEALKPFASFAEGLGRAVTDDMLMTKGSAMARQQVTAGDFRRAAKVLAALATRPAPSASQGASVIAEHKALYAEWEKGLGLNAPPMTTPSASSRQDLIAALEPFASVADRVLAEAPSNATEVTVFTDCEGCRHVVTVAAFRRILAAYTALASEPEPQPVAETKP